MLQASTSSWVNSNMH